MVKAAGYPGRQQLVGTRPKYMQSSRIDAAGGLLFPPTWYILANILRNGRI